MTSWKCLPKLVAHADWGFHPKKRWMAQALLVDGHYLALSPQLVGTSTALISQLRSLSGSNGSVFLGFDFPIGIPQEYARLAGISDFVSFLSLLGQGQWAQFFDIAKQPNQITLSRPFYPFCPGNTSHQHLIAGLGVQTMHDLLRICERRTTTRGNACVLFWTLGGKQVGRAAISGWRDVLIPALQTETTSIKIWPFQGALHDLLAPDCFVVAETYPTEFYGHLVGHSR